MDYQWPSLVCQSSATRSPISTPGELKRIEAFFQNKYNSDAICVVSARVAIKLILEYWHTNRSDIMFAPKWSSHCVFDAIGFLTNPTVTMTDEVTRVLAVHKWGSVYRCPSFVNPHYILEDSVDSFILKSDALFPNGGSFEILSLPKLLGVAQGGVILTKDNNFRAWLVQNNNSAGLHRPQIDEIEETLKLWNSFQNKIVERLCAVYEKIKKEDQIFHLGNRVGPLIPLPSKRYTVDGPELFMKRMFSSQKNLDNLHFEEHYLLPLHFAVDDQQFKKMLKLINVFA